MVASLRLVKSLARCLCCISSVFLVIQSIEKCSSVSFHCLPNVEEIKSFVLVKSPGDGQFYRKQLTITNRRLYIEVQHGLAVLISVTTKLVRNHGYVVHNIYDEAL